MTKQTKQAQLTEYKAIEDGSAGGFSAYATVFGELDDTGDIILSGAYKNTIPQFLKRGFIARSHDWNTAIGMPVAANEDTRGLMVEARYHNTPEAQQARTITNERQAAGLSSFVSIGYEPATTPMFIQPDAYDTEIPKYSAPHLAAQNLEKAQRFPEVRVLPDIHLYEISLVQVPALSSAVVTGAKRSEGPRDGLTLEEHSKSALAAVREYAEREADLSEIRTKEGRPISEARRKRIATALETLDGIKDDLRALLEETAPPPKTDDTSKQLDIQAVLNGLMVMDLQLKGVPIK